MPIKTIRANTGAHLFLFAMTLLLFLVSGYCGLVYQVVWTRKLTLILGTTSYAVSTVLGVFFLGLAFGSLWGGRLADKTKHPLRLYGIFEIAIGLWALFFLAAIHFGEGFIINLLGAAEVSRMAGVVLRALCSAALLFVPVFLMGATLPLLGKFVNRELRVQGRRIALLYSLNTIGAVLGCFSAGFFLLPTLGYNATTWVAAALNIGIGLISLQMSRMYEKASAVVPEESTLETDATNGATLKPHIVAWVLGVFALSGFCALALEVLWTRLLAIIFLGTTYAFSTMLGTMLLGIALGSAFASIFVDRLRARTGVLGLVLMGIGLACLFQLGWLADMPARVSELEQSSGNNWNGVVFGKIFMSFLVLFLPTFGFGMTFPLVVKAVGQSRGNLGRDIGKVYFANTLGGTFGALAGGYAIIPLLGTHWGIVILAFIQLVAGFCLVYLCPDLPKKVKAPLPALFLLMAGMAWQLAPADVNQALNAGYVPEDHRVLHYKEGVEGTVTVTEPNASSNGGDRVLYINRVQATTTIERGVKMNRFQGALPLLFNRDPRRVLFICLGSGITCGTLALYDFESIDAVEISQDVLDAAPYFESDNLGVLKRPNVRFHINDGRNYLMTSREKYDLITFEPMPLALAGVSTFYSTEFYRECLDHLAPGGMVSQWFPFHSLNPEIVRSLVSTFAQVFPEYCGFFVNADLFLIGSNEELLIDFAQFEKRFETGEFNAALKAAGFGDAMEVAATFVMDKAGVDAFAAGGRVMSDGLPWAEFEAPKLVYNRQVPETVTLMQGHTSPIAGMLVKENLSGETLAKIAARHASHLHDFDGLKLYYAGMLLGGEVAEAFVESLEIDPGNMNARYYLKDVVMRQGETYTRWEKFAEARELIQGALRFMPEDADLLGLMETLKAEEKASLETTR